MTKKKFRHDFLRGLGSALHELKISENPQQYYDIVHYGCLHNTTTVAAAGKGLCV